MNKLEKHSLMYRFNAKWNYRAGLEIDALLLYLCHTSFSRYNNKQ
jgi:hypothetical protein